MAQVEPLISLRAISDPGCETIRHAGDPCNGGCTQTSRWLSRPLMFCEGNAAFKALVGCILKMHDAFAQAMCNLCLRPKTTDKDEWLDSLDCECLSAFGAMIGLQRVHCVTACPDCSRFTVRRVVESCGVATEYRKVCACLCPQLYKIDLCEGDDPTLYLRMIRAFLKALWSVPNIANMAQCIGDAVGVQMQVIYSGGGELGVIPAAPLTTEQSALFEIARDWFSGDVDVCLLRET